MKKQSGFTLIELMVVMAIIAILATAGLSAYTGYIKKARDATRIADLAAINTIVLASLSTNGSPPATLGDLIDAIEDANNGQVISDPLYNIEACTTSFDGWNNYELTPCTYMYWDDCTSGGYALSTYFESSSNFSLYEQNASWGAVDDAYEMGLMYDVGSCLSPINPLWFNSPELF